MGRRWIPTSQNKIAYCFLFPSLLGTAIFVLIPFLDVIRRSFYQAVGGIFVGISNYKEVLENAAYQQALSNTLRFLIVCLPLLMALSFGFAVLIYQLPSRRSLYEAGFLFPMAVPVASLVVFWRLVFHNDGILNQMLEVFHLSGRDWMNTD
ncbi:MAG TPA: sugar ABC transporter permease, partial [Candidatus Pelethocola excrementipullorum]|nr:sugar ABC transporter permease [Candidatus Pelethocola excrementipullorum]